MAINKQDSDSDELSGAGIPGFTNEEAQAAQEALVHRPRFSIRLRIMLSFLLPSILTCIIIVAAMVLISNLDRKQNFLERAGDFEFEIQQARRYEKNYLLYKTNLEDALSHVKNAEDILNNFGNEIGQAVGVDAYDKLLSHLKRYRETLEKLNIANSSNDSISINESSLMEADLRNYGGAILTDASNAINQERLRIHSWLQTSMFVAAAALVLIFILEILMATLVARQIIRRFSRFEKYTKRIASGDFTLITPVRKYRDEFTNLSLAINHMLIELKRRAKQLILARKMAAVGNLTAGIAHELNNPLNNISLTTESLIDEYDEWDRDQKLKMLGDIAVQVERASATVANLLDFTRRDETAFENLHINDVLISSLKFVANEMKLNQVESELELARDLPLIQGNYHNLQQVFLNLLMNAIQAMPEGGKLRVKSHIIDNFVCVEVDDSGVGIARQYLSKIFDPFFTTKDVGKGTGLGLSVSYGIIERHHGSIEVESEVGKGTTFIVKFPATSPVLQSGSNNFS